MGDAKAVASLTSSLPPSSLPGPASKASLPVVACYFSPKARLPSHPLGQPVMLLSPKRYCNVQPLLSLALLCLKGSRLLYFCLKSTLLPNQFLPSKKGKSEEYTPTHTTNSARLSSFSINAQSSEYTQGS